MLVLRLPFILGLTYFMLHNYDLVNVDKNKMLSDQGTDELENTCYDV